MTIETYKIDDIELNIVTTEKGCRHIALIQKHDVIVMSVDQARRIKALIGEI